MKRKLWLYHLLGAILASFLSISVIGCLITGFKFPVDSMFPLLIWCCIFSVLSALLFRFRFGGWILLCLMAIAAVFGFDREALWEELQTIAYMVTSHYHEIYGWQIFGDSLRETVAQPLVALSLLTALSVTFCWSRRTHIVIALISVIVPVVPVFFTIDTVPDGIYLYLLILGVSMLLLTDWVRKNNPVHCTRLALRIAVPIAVALALIFFLNPRESYVNRSSALKNEVASWFQKLEVPEEIVPDVNIPEAAVSKRLRLRNVGPKNPYAYPVMRVNSPIDGVLYLRGQDYDSYTGTGWEATEERIETFSSGFVSTGKVSIVTYGVRDILYIPYYAMDAVELHAGSISNTDRLQSYDFFLAREPESYTASFDLAYTSLPYDTYKWSKEMADEITAGSRTDAERVQAICQYVRSSAVYDLSTPRMDTDQDDFALWFLTDSDTGYCVHFATAATVLLRSAGIPARYVEGYAVICRSGEDTTVSNQDAHAWAEYYDAEAGVWRILEATPADFSGQEETSTEQAAAPTEPSESLPDPTEDTIEQETQSQNPTVNTDKDKPVNQTPSRDEPFELPEWVSDFAWILFFVILLILQAMLRIAWKRRRWNRGRPNEKALYRWNQLVQLSRLISISLPEELELLAQKAKFSQHTLTREELAQFGAFRSEALGKLKEAPWYRRFYMRWIMAID